MFGVSELLDDGPKLAFGLRDQAAHRSGSVEKNCDFNRSPLPVKGRLLLRSLVRFNFDRNRYVLGVDAVAQDCRQ